MIEDEKMMPCSGLLWCHLNSCFTSSENCEVEKMVQLEMIEDEKMMPCSGLLWCHLNACFTSSENCEAVVKNWEIDSWAVKNRKVILINQF